MAERKSWKAYAVVSMHGRLVFESIREYRRWTSGHRSLICGDRIVRVTITVDETKKKKGKVGRG